MIRVATIIAALTANPVMAKPHKPRLVGYGCEGAAGPIYADEEDQFPRCKVIKRNVGETKESAA